MSFSSAKLSFFLLAGAVVGLPHSPLGAQESKKVYGPPAPARPGAEQAVEALPPPPNIPAALQDAALATAWTHPSVRAAEGQIRAAGFDVRAAKWLRFPSVTVEALAISQGNTASAAQSGAVLNVVVEQPIWTGGRIGSAIDRAKAQELTQKSGLDEVVRDLLLRTLQAYYDVAAQARRIEVLTDALSQHRALIATIENRVEQQISASSDLDLAKSRSAQVEQQLAVAEAQRQASLNSLVELTGTSIPNLGNVPTYDPAVHHPVREGAVEQALACDPRTARLTGQSLVAKAEQRAAKAALMPQLVGQVSRNEILGERVGLALRAQTGNGLSQAVAAQGARARAEATEASIATAQRDLREALRSDFAINEAAQARIASSGAAVKNSRIVIESYKRQFIAGRRTWLDVMNALQETTSNRLAVIDSENSAQLTAARIALRTCRWEPRPRFQAELKELSDVRE